jgi:peptidoglycan hydrolase-like protein with peptidoglycan-binding domain
MHIRLFSKIATTLLLMATLGLPASAVVGRQTTTPKTTAKGSRSSTAKKVPANARSARRRKARQRAQTVPTPARISEIQSALAAQGAYKGQPNGKWDAATAQGMKDYQSAHGLTATGKLDALTLQKLGLGSEIAGRAAPLPTPQTHGAPAASQQQSP